MAIPLSILLYFGFILFLIPDLTPFRLEPYNGTFYTEEDTTMIWKTLGVLCFAAAGAMYVIGGNSSHLTELKDFFWVPLPPGILLFLIGKKKKS
ncbi:MAG: hypothetical protein HY541_08305 [Deltaproteobacteria bacterium]|nr:hypothetical protein [Deltaproteobacteria bacterium]